MRSCLKQNKTDRLSVAIVLRLGSLVVRDVGSQQLSAIWLDSVEAARDESRGPTANQPGPTLLTTATVPRAGLALLRVSLGAHL